MPQDKQNTCKLAHCKCMQITPCSNHHYSDCGWVFNKPHTPTSPKTATEEKILKEFDELVSELNSSYGVESYREFVIKAFKAGEALGQQNKIELVDKTEDWEKEFDEKFVSSSETYDVFTGTAATHPYLVKDFIRSLLEKQLALGQQNGMRMVVGEIPDDMEVNATDENSNDCVVLTELKQQIKDKYNL